MANLYARATARWCGAWWVWTEDFDGDVRLRRVETTPFGKSFVHGIIGGPYGKRARVCADGTVTGVAYMKRWRTAYGRPRLSVSVPTLDEEWQRLQRVR